MSEVHDLPGYNPAQSGSLEGLLQYVSDQINMDLACCMPGIVVEYDRKTNMAVIQPAISAVASSGQKITRDKLYNISVLTLSGGGFFVSFPLKTGDIGWLLVNDRDISLFKQTLQESAPNTYHKHKLVDSVFVPDKIKNFNITDEDLAALVISNLSGSSKIALSEAAINLTAPKVNIQSLVAVTDDLSAASLHPQNGASGTFISQDNKTITVTDGIITGIA